MSRPDIYYGHLAKADAATFPSYEPWQVRDERRHVLLLFSRTGMCRLYPRLDVIAEFYNWSVYTDSVFTRADQLDKQFFPEELRILYNIIIAEEPPYTALCKRDDIAARDLTLMPESAEDIPDKELPDRLWELCQLVADRQSKVQRSEQKADQYKYHVHLDRINMEADDIKALPKQARIIVANLKSEAVSGYRDEDINSFMRKLVGGKILKTKQDPTRIFKYYAPVIMDLGLMDYNRRASTSED